MQTFEAIETRRSVKHYDPEHKMTEEEIKQLMSNAMLSPTSFNIQNWRFLVITDTELRSQIKDAAWGQDQVTNASLLIIVCGDTKAYAKDPARYWKDAPAEASSKLVPMITQFYEGKPELQRDEAIRSGSIASQTIMLTAKQMGYDSCPMIGFDPVKVAELTNMPEDVIPVIMITVGKALKPAWPRSGQLSYDEVVIRDKF